MSPAGHPEVTLRIPRTAARRGAITWAKLLRRVYADAVCGGWTFEGELLRPGASVDLSELPEPALLLECAGSDGDGWGHRRAGTVYLLWRLDRRAGEWRELARVHCVNADWTFELGPIAKNELEPPRLVRVDPDRSARRVMAALEKEIRALDPRARRLVLLKVYDEVASRTVA